MKTNSFEKLKDYGARYKRKPLEFQLLKAETLKKKSELPIRK
jgi:hypothetical protein